MDIAALIDLQGVMFLQLVAGLILRRAGIAGKDTQKDLTKIVINVLLPANIIHAFQVEMNGEILKAGGIIILVSVVIQIFLSLFSACAYNRLPQNQKMIFQYGTVCSNAGILGNTIAGAVYGELGTLYAALFVIPQRIVMWTAGVSYFTEAPSPREVVRKVLRHPCIIAVEIGLFLMLTQLPLPGALNSAIRSLGNCTSPITMLFLGMVLADCGFRGLFTPVTMLYCLLRLLLIPAVVLIGCCIARMPAAVTGVAVLMAAMPAGTTTAIVASQYDGDVEFAANIVVVSTLLSILILPLWVLFTGAMV